ncbi:hypothetical protein [Ornithinimicrobium cerasi]|uniref:Cyanophycinase n=1 Tax=Ornithinimicrobium cerasi TaxID=2248773 RepID=A0A285VI56_9MICO|nr:hypothetical protein [Ornithinimicrobium cerasi]SOC53749.1 cyanophycinase [Ornithinimicrobium cerasi]
MSRTTRLPLVGLTGLALAAGALTPGLAAAQEDPPQRFVPIGGGYDVSTLEGFGAEAAEHATDGTVDLYVIPATYGDDPADREENLELAQQRADQIDAACESVVTAPTTCATTLLPILQRSDALDPAVSAPLREPGVDGMYVLGGDQVLAMQVLANTPAEEAMEFAFERGAIVGGTSAGNAVESRSMGAGYPAPGWPYNALERDMSIIFWGDDLVSDERGLSFGSEQIIFDQHFYERGRFGRLLSWVGQSVERYGEPGKLGIGVDWGTGLVVTDDALAADAFGVSSSAIIDASRATGLDWVGPRDTLSVDDVLTHLLAPGTGLTYDVTGRSVSVDGTVVEPGDRAALPNLSIGGRGSLWLGGGQNNRATSEPLAEFVDAARSARPASRGGAILLATVAYTDADARNRAVTSYSAALRAVGWTGEIEAVDAGDLSSAEVARAAGLLVVGGDQSLLDDADSDRTLGRVLSQAVQQPGPVMTDDAATALLGSTYVADPTPGEADRSFADDAIAMFRADEVDTREGLGLVDGYQLEPWLTYDYRWGRLYGAAYDRPDVVSLGISEQTALRVDRDGATLTGLRSAIVVDGRSADWMVGSNGALGAANVWMDVLGEGDRLP